MEEPVGRHWVGGKGQGGREEERLTKETSCCLHTNPKLIMSGGAGAGQELSWQEPLPAEESAQDHHGPPSAIPHSGPSPRTPSDAAVHLLLGLRRGGWGWQKGPSLGDLAPSTQGWNPSLQVTHILIAAPGRAKAQQSSWVSAGPGRPRLQSLSSWSE